MAAQPTGIDVKLGEHEYRVRPQRHAYLKREIRKFFSSLQELQDMDAENLLDVFTEKAYELLSVFIPDLMERWEFEGFASQDAMERDHYTEDDDRSPEPGQIREALSAAMRVNDLDWVGQLKNFIGTDLLKAQMRAAVAEWAAEQRKPTMEKEALTVDPRKNSTTTPASLPPENGASTPESSGTRLPTSPEPQTTS